MGLFLVQGPTHQENRNNHGPVQNVGVVGQKWGKIWSQAYNTDCNSKQTNILPYSVLIGNMTWFLKPFLKHSIPDTIYL